jgi:hypothetical protein
MSASLVPQFLRDIESAPDKPNARTDRGGVGFRNVNKNADRSVWASEKAAGRAAISGID